MDCGQTVNGGHKLFMYHNTAFDTYWIIDLCTWGMWKGTTCLIYEFLLDLINYQIRFLLNIWLVSVPWWTNEAAKTRCKGADAYNLKTISLQRMCWTLQGSFESKPCSGRISGWILPVVMLCAQRGKSKPWKTNISLPKSNCTMG